MWIVGIDLTWGWKNRDGVCLLRVQGRSGKADMHELAYPHGDDELLAWLDEKVGTKPALLLIDAPIVCPNETGTRPVDRLTHRLFHRQHAACHPASFQKCPRPVLLTRKLVDKGFAVGWDVSACAKKSAPGLRLVSEVYPHPAMVRLFHLERIIKYKKGSVTERRAEFCRLQRCLRTALTEYFPQLTVSTALKKLLREPWAKPVEDRTDAFFCALIGYHHWQHSGRCSEVIGDLATGFILLPKTPAVPRRSSRERF